MSTVRVRVAVADDDSAIRSLLEEILNTAHDVVGAAANGQELVLMVDQHCPDLVVLDVTMPVMSGFEALEQCRRDGCTAHFVFCTERGGRAYVQQALRLGARGYVRKAALMEELLPAVGTVIGGGIFISPGIVAEA